MSDVGIILSGNARSIKTDAKGKLVIVSLLGPGDYIGVLLAASKNRKSPVTVQALGPVSALFIPLQNLLTCVDCPYHSVLLANLLDGVAEKALVPHDRNDCLIKSSVRDKVMTYLAREAAAAGSRMFKVPLNRNAMAEYLNVDRSALSRELARMKRDGLIDYHKNHFKLL